MKNLIIIALLTTAINLSAQVSVIANKSVSESTVSAVQVSNIYTFTTTKWANGNKIIVFDNGSDIKNAFYSAIGKDLLSLKKEWMKKQLTGEAKAPETLGSDADVVAKVSSTPGSIGYVRSGNTNSSVKIIVELK